MYLKITPINVDQALRDALQTLHAFEAQLGAELTQHRARCQLLMTAKGMF